MAHHNLRLLCAIRLIPLAGMLYGAWCLVEKGASHLHWEFILALVLALFLIVGMTWLRTYRTRPISQLEFLAHLIVDITIYSLLMFNSGGAANPFISYLLVPVTIAAITLQPMLAWTTTALCLSAYSVLLFWYVPLPVVSPGHSGHIATSQLNPHLVGMWITFVASALLITFFASRMATIIRRQEESINRQQQQQLEDDQLLAVASLAASAAHELGTPLNTMKVIVDDWPNDNPPGNGYHDLTGDITLLKNQVERCQGTLQKLSNTARTYTSKVFADTTPEDYFTTLIDNWLVMRPDVKASVSIDGNDHNGIINLHPSVSASLHSLLNNAADACPDNVEVVINWTTREANLLIRDYGQGVGSQVTAEGPVKSDKPHGMGLGLFLARSILERHGASIQLESLASGGTQVHVTLPLRSGNA